MSSLGLRGEKRGTYPKLAIVCALGAPLILACSGPEFTDCKATKTCAPQTEAGAGGSVTGSGGNQTGGTWGGVGGSGGKQDLAGSGGDSTSGGSAGASGNASAGAAGNVAVLPACTAVRVAGGGEPLIDDFADGNAAISSWENRIGEWVVSKSPTATLASGEVGKPFLPTDGGNPDKAIHVVGSDFNAADPVKAWGAELMANLVKSESATSGECYDASVYAGIRASMRGIGKVRLRVWTASARERIPEPYETEIGLTKDWRAHEVRWKDLHRASDGAFLADQNRIYALSLLPIVTDRTFDFSIDNVRFMQAPGTWEKQCGQPSVPDALVSDFSAGNAANLQTGGVATWRANVEVVDGSARTTLSTMYDWLMASITLDPTCVDLSRYTGVAFRIKADKATQLQWFVRTEETRNAMMFHNLQKPITVAPEWTEFWMPFSALNSVPQTPKLPEAYDASQRVQAFGVCSVDSTSLPVIVSIDDVRLY